MIESIDWTQRAEKSEIEEWTPHWQCWSIWQVHWEIRHIYKLRKVSFWTLKLEYNELRCCMSVRRTTTLFLLTCENQWRCHPLLYKNARTLPEASHYRKWRGSARPIRWGDLWHSALASPWEVGDKSRFVQIPCVCVNIELMPVFEIVYIQYATPSVIMLLVFSQFRVYSFC
jgi:hypothetical protein